MGCCQSREAASETVAVRRQAPIQAQPRASPSASSIESRVDIIDGSATRLTGDDRPNKPIRPPTPVRSSPAHVSHLAPPWTREQLTSERNAFFETRIAGRSEVWSAIRLVSELLQHNDIEQAQGILDAVDVTCPNGRVAAGRGRDRARGGLYDAFGELYEVPAWIVTDPRDTIETAEKSTTTMTTPLEQAEQVDAARREEKGKGRAPDLGDMMQLRARLSDRGTDAVVSVGSKETVAAIVRKIQQQIGAKRLRLLYMGQVLTESKTLAAQGYKAGDVVNAFVFEGGEEMLLASQRKQKHT